ncbi:MAG: dihydropteroate synthase [Methanocorpusculum sp.]|nr:dihydropteroate synthase [Methanocorpusculum sp.]
MSREIRIKSVSVGGNNPPRILGVLNISPESFFSDSFTPCSQVFRRAEEMRRAGADIIDLGARSTALNAPPISAAEEKERVVTALKDLDGCGIPISLDTCRPEVLTAALHYDIALVNDISGLTDVGYAKAVADSGLPAILMAADTVPGDPLTFAETEAAISLVLSRAETYGIEDIILDPGVGKWTDARTSEADWELCRRFSALQEYNLPLLAAVSRKSFIGECLNKPSHERLFGSLAVFYHLMEAGADLLRVHDVGPAADFVRVFTRLNGED